MQTTRFEMVLRATEPVSHGMESMGNDQVFMSKTVRLPGGARVTVPYITGNSIRHQLREAATYGTLHAAGILDDPQLSEGACRLLFNGGMVTGKGNAAVIKLDQYRKLVSLFPPLALLGGCTDNRPMAGQLDVSAANVLCTEMRHITPPWVLDWAATNNETLDSVYGSLHSVQRVHMDALSSPDKVALLNDVAKANLNARLLKSEKAHEDADSKAKGESKSSIMPYTFDTLIDGTLFWWGVEARTYSDLEFDAFCFTVACALNNFRFGGKSGTGHGRVQFVAGARIAFAPTAGSLENCGSELAPQTGDIYRAHVLSKKEELTSWIRSNINS